jgi:hypothetical protein
MKTFIVLFEIEDNRNARKEAEHIENSQLSIEYTGDGWDKITSHKVLNHLHDKLDIKSKIVVYSLTDFMDAFNDEYINADEYFTSYVHAEVKGVEK